MKFTERAIKELTPIGKPFDVADETLRGLLVRVQPSGVMTYWYAYRTHQGRKSRISLGRCDSVSLVKAKELAKRYAGQVAAGIDPQAQRQEQKANAKQEKVKALGAFIKEVYEPWATSNRKSYKKTLRIGLPCRSALLTLRLPAGPSGPGPLICGVHPAPQGLTGGGVWQVQ